jgi:transposase
MRSAQECEINSDQRPFLAGQGHRTLRFEAAVARACESAPVRRVAAQGGLPRETGRQIDQRAWQRWAAGRPRKPLRFMGVEEIYRGKQDNFLTVVSKLATRAALWAGGERKRESLDRCFAEALPPRGRRAGKAVCVDRWEPYTQSLRAHLPQARIVYDKFHVLQPANAALDETRRAAFFRHGGDRRGWVRGKRWLLLRRGHRLPRGQRPSLNELFAPNRRWAKADQLRERLERLGSYPSPQGPEVHGGRQAPQGCVTARSL